MKINYKYLFMAGLLTTGMTACVDDNDWGTDSSHNRLFGAQDIQVSAMATTAEVTFDRLPSVDYYILELNTDSLYQEDFHAGSRIDTVRESPYILTGLTGETTYFLRIKAFSNSGTAPSLWSYFEDGDLRSFETDGEQIFYSVASADRTENTIRLTWLAEAEVTHVDIYASEEAFEAGEAVLQTYEITADDLAAAACTISGLEAQTEYWFVIYNGETKRGEIGASTTAPMPDADLKISLEEGITLIDQVLIDDLAAQAQAAAGGASDYSLTLGIPGGATIDVHGVDEETGEAAGLAIPEGMSVTFFALPGERPTLNFPKSLEIGGTHGYIRFDGLTIVDSGCQYFVNESAATEVNEFGLINCEINGMERSLVRLQGSGEQTIHNILIDNCLLENMSSGNGYSVIYANKANYTINEITFTNTTVNVAQRSFIEVANATVNAITFDACTFYNMPASGRYVIDANSTNANVSIENCIFGFSEGKGIRTGGEVTVFNSFKTTDCAYTGNNFDVDVTSPEAASAEVFTDPENGDFTLLIDDLNGIGDPRWYTE